VLAIEDTTGLVAAEAPLRDAIEHLVAIDLTARDDTNRFIIVPVLYSIDGFFLLLG